MIGIMDWGIGGLSVYKTLPAHLSLNPVLYFSDSGFTPYGKTERATLRERLARIASFFAERGVHEVYVACNAASSALNSDHEKFKDVVFHSIIPAGIEAVRVCDAHRVGVIGGELTMNSGLYQKRLADLDRCFSFTSAQPLSAFVESGELEGAAVEAAITSVLSRLGSIDALLLACTHYPAFRQVFQRLAPSLTLLDPAQYVWQFPEHDVGSTQLPHLSLVTTGSVTQTQIAAHLAWNLNVPDLLGVALNGQLL
jgi:glutamate racemase